MLCKDRLTDHVELEKSHLLPAGINLVGLGGLNGFLKIKKIYFREIN